VPPGRPQGVAFTPESVFATVYAMVGQPNLPFRMPAVPNDIKVTQLKHPCPIYLEPEWEANRGALNTLDGRRQYLRLLYALYLEFNALIVGPQAEPMPAAIPPVIQALQVLDHQWLQGLG
jgi:hypothetical protein